MELALNRLCIIPLYLGLVSTWEIEASYQDDTFHSLEWTQIEPRCKRLVNLSTFTQWTELVCTRMIGT